MITQGLRRNRELGEGNGQHLKPSMSKDERAPCLWLLLSDALLSCAPMISHESPFFYLPLSLLSFINTSTCPFQSLLGVLDDGLRHALYAFQKHSAAGLSQACRERITQHYGSPQGGMHWARNQQTVGLSFGIVSVQLHVYIHIKDANSLLTVILLFDS